MATPLGTGTTAEAQVTSADDIGGLQLEVTPSFLRNFNASSQGRQLDPLLTPQSAGLDTGDLVILSETENGELISVTGCHSLADIITCLGPRFTSLLEITVFDQHCPHCSSSDLAYRPRPALCAEH